MTPEQTAGLVGYIAAACPSWKVTKETIAVYHDLLSDLPVERCQEAVRHLLSTAGWTPTPASIRQRFFGSVGLLAPSQGEAWAQVRAQIQAVGSQRPSFDSEAVRRAVEILGWYEIRTSTNIDTVRAQFWKVYGEIVVELDSKTLASPPPSQIENTRRKELEPR